MIAFAAGNREYTASRPFEVAADILEKLIWHHYGDVQRPGRRAWIETFVDTKEAELRALLRRHNSDRDHHAFFLSPDGRGITSWNERSLQTNAYRNATTERDKIKHCMKVILSRILGKEIDSQPPRLQPSEYTKEPDLREHVAPEQASQLIQGWKAARPPIEPQNYYNKRSQEQDRAYASAKIAEMGGAR